MRKSTILFVAILAFACKHSNNIHPQRKDLVETVYASGKIISNNEYNLFALSAGSIIRKLVKDGDTVHKGQVLYVINYSAPAAKMDAAANSLTHAQQNLSQQSRILNDLRIAIETAQTKLSNDSLQYIRLKNLMAQGIGTQSNLDIAFTNYRVSQDQKKSALEKYESTKNDLDQTLAGAKSQAASARSDLDNYFLRAEQDGIVFQTLKELGESVKPNEAVALLGDASDRLIRLAVDQQDIARIRLGQDLLLKTDATGNQIFKARVSRIYPVMNEIDQTFRVDAIFADSLPHPFIHCSVEANIIIQSKKNILVLPKNALVGDDSVQIMQDGKKITVAVQSGIKTLNDIEITGGLDEKSEVILQTKN